MLKGDDHVTKRRYLYITANLPLLRRMDRKNGFRNWWWNASGTSWLGKGFCFSVQEQTGIKGLPESIRYSFGRGWRRALDTFKTIAYRQLESKTEFCCALLFFCDGCYSLKVTEIHWAFKFDQNLRIKKFIDALVSKFFEAKTKVEK